MKIPIGGGEVLWCWQRDGHSMAVWSPQKIPPSCNWKGDGQCCDKTSPAQVMRRAKLWIIAEKRFGLFLFYYIVPDTESRQV